MQYTLLPIIVGMPCVLRNIPTTAGRRVVRQGALPFFEVGGKVRWRDLSV